MQGFNLRELYIVVLVLAYWNKGLGYFSYYFWIIIPAYSLVTISYF